MALMPFIAVMAGSCEKNNNSDPVISTVQVNPSTINAGGVTHVSVTATDPDGDKLTYSYSVSGGSISGSGANVIWKLPSASGNQTITVVADDGNKGKAEKTFTISTQAAMTQISGYAIMQGGGYLDGTKAFLYSGYPSASTPILNIPVVAVGSTAVFNITGITAGDYYLMLWKDCDNNRDASVGDFLGWYGDGDYHTPSFQKITVADNATFQCYIKMYNCQ